MFGRISLLADYAMTLTPVLGPMVAVTVFCWVLGGIECFLLWVALMVPAAVVSGLLSLLPSVRAARIRILRLNLPPDG